MKYIRLGTLDVKHLVNPEDLDSEEKYTICGINVGKRYLNNVTKKELVEHKNEFCTLCYKDKE